MAREKPNGVRTSDPLGVCSVHSASTPAPDTQRRTVTNSAKEDCDDASGEEALENGDPLHICRRPEPPDAATVCAAPEPTIDTWNNPRRNR